MYHSASHRRLQPVTQKIVEPDAPFANDLQVRVALTCVENLSDATELRRACLNRDDVETPVVAVLCGVHRRNVRRDCLVCISLVG